MAAVSGLNASPVNAFVLHLFHGTSTEPSSFCLSWMLRIFNFLLRLTLQDMDDDTLSFPFHVALIDDFM